MLAASPHVPWGSRMRGLDGVRAFSVIAVIAAHSHVPWLYGGGLGVDMFFALSGFLITGLLLREFATVGRISVGRFWGRRLLRLMPALILLVVVVDGIALVAPARLGGLGETGLVATPGVLFYFSNWLIVVNNGAALGPFGPLWSLSVEEQFYLVWPLVLIVVFHLRHRLRWLFALAAASCLAVAVFRLVTFDPNNLYPTFGTGFRVDSLLMGCLLAMGFQAGLWNVIQRFARVAIFPAVAYLIFIAIFTPEFNQTGVNTRVYLFYVLGLPLIAFSTAVLIAFIVTYQGRRLTGFLSLRPLPYVGRISYGMYLWHYPIILILQVRFAPDPNVVFVSSLVLTLGAASVSWYLVERPLSQRFHSRLVVRPVEGVSASANVQISSEDAFGDRAVRS